MKHNFKITTVLIIMFIITQLIGLFVIGVYNSENNKLPFGMEPPEKIKEDQGVGFLQTILIAFVFAIFLFFLLTKINAEKFIRIWFFIVVALALSLSFKAVLLFKIKDILINIPVLSGISLLSILVFLIALPFAYIKIFKRNMFVHNITELLIYPGIAAVFIPILNLLGIVILLLIISFYDIWAVWHSRFMEKMAKYQINNLKFFAGFFVPYTSKKQKQKIKLLKQKYGKKPQLLEKEFKKSKIKINLAILGGGDVIFPIITAGIVLKTSGIIPALIITLFATLALLFLFVLARKGKFYPAMPFLTIGMYLGIILNLLIF